MDEDKVITILEKYGFRSNQLTIAEYISYAPMMELSDNLIILDALWQCSKKRGFPNLSNRLKLRLINNFNKLKKLFPEFLRGTLSSRDFYELLLKIDFSDDELLEIWALFFLMNPEQSNRGLDEINKYIPIESTVESMIKLLRKIKILDLGCGKSAIAISELASRYKGRVECYGIDIANNEKSTLVTVVRGNIKRMPFSSNSFDLIYSANVLLYFSGEKLQEIVLEALRVLKTGGIFLCDRDPKTIKPLLENLDIEVSIEQGKALSSIIRKLN